MDKSRSREYGGAGVGLLLVGWAPASAAPLGGGEVGQGHDHRGGAANATINEALNPFIRFFAASLASLRHSSLYGAGQPEREASLFNLKFLCSPCRVYVRQLADGRVFAAVCGQPVFALLDAAMHRR